MSNLTITRAAFKNTDIFCGDIPLNDNELAEPDMFLPILLLYIDKALSNKAMLEQVVSYDLVFKKSSLFFVEAQNVEIKNEVVLLNIINEMTRVQMLFEKVACDASDHERYDLKRLCEYIRGKSPNVAHENRSASVIHFDFLFLHVQLPIFADDFIEKQRELLQSNDVFDLLGLNKHGNANDNSVPFNLKESYPLLDGQDKKIFDELAVLACADFLSENPEVESVADIEHKKLPVIDELLLFAALINNTEILAGLAHYYHCQTYQIVFDDAIYALREKLKFTATTRSFDVNSSSTTWYACAAQYAQSLQLNETLSYCFSAAIENNKLNISRFVNTLTAQSTSIIKHFLSLNSSRNISVKTAMASQKIQQRLNKIVIGQENAVNTLCQGYLTSSIEVLQGPRLIYTFVGPSGVGKTYLATQLQAQLNAFEKSGYVLNIFNMEHYADQRDSMKLFGSSIQYSDISLGMLTSEVRAQPRQVLLFDEIEKAHSVVIQSLLSILDSGIAKDQASQEKVDFSQCIIIFTTNLGQEALKNNHQNNSLSVFELLQQSENPSNKTKLSPEFINRLAKGFPVLFSELKVNHLLRIAEMQVNSSESSRSQISYDWPENFSSLMLQSMSPDISVRALKSCFTKHKSMLLNHAIPHLNENMPSINFQIAIEEKTHDKPLAPVRLLLLDDDSRVFDQVKALDLQCELFLCSEIDKLRHSIEYFHPDAVLIDTETVSKHGGQLAQVTSELLKRNEKMTIFTYQLTELAFLLKKQSDVHDVREHFDVSISDFKASFASMLSRVEYYLETERLLTNMKRKNEQLQYQCEVSLEGEVLHANYKQLSTKRLVQSIDLNEGELFKHSLPTLKLNDVIGLDRAKKRLADVINWLKSPEKLANFGVNVPSGFLFAGPPGTGKTFLAKALAGESGLPFFSVSSSELSESHSGGTTQNIKKLFATARKYAPAIIFIDEIDAIAAKRSNAAQGADRDRNLTVNALLTEMDGFTPQSDPIFILAATNHPQLLDSAIVRPGRFDETIHCDLPNAKARKEFFVRFSAKHQIHFTAEQLKQLISSSLGMSSAEIEQVFRESIYEAVGANKPLTSDDIKQTMIRVSYGLPSDHLVLSKEEKMRTAYHEAGHLLLSKLLFPKQPIDFVTIEPRNNSLGFVATREADEYESLSRNRVKHRLEVLLAGRMAEKIYTGSLDEVSSGASSDIDKATRLAMHVIYDGGLEPSVGPVNVGLLTKYEESDLLLKAQSAVQKWLLEAESSVEERLIAHRVLLDDIANALIEKESLLSDEIQTLFSSCEGRSE